MTAYGRASWIYGHYQDAYPFPHVCLEVQITTPPQVASDYLLQPHLQNKAIEYPEGN